MAKDLENWLGNLYFEVIKMPRYHQSTILISVTDSACIITQIFGRDEGI